MSDVLRALQNVLMAYGVFVIALGAVRYTILRFIRLAATSDSVLWINRLASLLLMIATLICVWAVGTATSHS